MDTYWNPESLAAFEKDVADAFNRGEIRAPVHLAGGNERCLIKIFNNIKPEDWICCTWRSHYHALLKGVPPGDVMAAIHEGRSIALCFHEYKMISSAMVGGILPIAVGLAWAAKRRKTGETVWAFVGDMAATGGLYRESHRYARGHGLPLKIVVEDNRKSVATDTAAAWGPWAVVDEDPTIGYRYDLPHVHVGTGQWVTFPDSTGGRTGL